MVYKTKLGDTWDIIAKSAYGDELYADFLMENNPKLIGIFVFGVGTEVFIPELKEAETKKLPPWRR